MDSGLTLDKALSILVDLAEKPQAKEVLTEVHKQVHAGSSFANALAAFPKVFSKLYINMIRAGEAGGTLAPSLNRVADFLEKSEELKANIRSAMVYPAILTSVGRFCGSGSFHGSNPKVFQVIRRARSGITAADKNHVVPEFIYDQSLARCPHNISSRSGVFYILSQSRKRPDMHWDGIVLKLPMFGSLETKDRSLPF